MKKILLLLLIVLVAAAAVMLWLGDGFGFGGGTGEGDKGGEASQQAQEPEPPEEDEEQPAPKVDIVIEVRQGEYMVDGEAVSLAGIEGMIHESDAQSTTFILRDDYASAKAWDDVKALFAEHEINVVEE